MDNVCMFFIYCSLLFFLLTKYYNYIVVLASYHTTTTATWRHGTMTLALGLMMWANSFIRSRCLPTAAYFALHPSFLPTTSRFEPIIAITACFGSTTTHHCLFWIHCHLFFPPPFVLNLPPPIASFEPTATSFGYHHQSFESTTTHSSTNTCIVLL